MEQQRALPAGIYECYERNGQPMKRWLYRSEKPFAWAAGIIVSAFDQYQKNQ
ncbi:MAG TPA: hypothetical protein VGA89_00980 [Patescibacteria group bacterium]